MRVALFGFSVLTLLACSTGTGLARCDGRQNGVVCARLDEPFDARVGETAYIADTHFSLRVEGVPEDSRCPREAVCVWAGNARVALTLRGMSNTAAADLNSTLEPRAVTRWGYTVELVDVQPLPTAGTSVPVQEYVIRLRVKRA